MSYSLVISSVGVWEGEREGVGRECLSFIFLYVFNVKTNIYYFPTPTYKQEWR